MKAVQLGYGYWGRNVARELNRARGISFLGIHDISDEAQQEARQLYADITLYDSFDAVLQSDAEAVFIVTPPETHYELAKKALSAGKHVFVEKPITTDLKQAYDLIELAEKKNVILFADHVFLHSEPVKYLKKIVSSGELGDIVYINSRRVNLGLFQYKVDVIWDLAIHDISIIDHLIGFDIDRVSVFRKRYQDFPHPVLANISADLKNNTTVGINVSWLSPIKVREMIIGGTEKMVVYDDTCADKIKIFDHGVILKDNLDKQALHEKLVQYRIGGVEIPDLPKGDSLTNAVHDFFLCVTEGKEPVTGRQSIINTIQALEIISRV